MKFRGNSLNSKENVYEQQRICLAGVKPFQQWTLQAGGLKGQCWEALLFLGSALLNGCFWYCGVTAGGVFAVAGV